MATPTPKHPISINGNSIDHYRANITSSVDTGKKTGKIDNKKQTVVALVNAANEKLAYGGGVCGKIFDAAGKEKLEKLCAQVDKDAPGTPCKTGNAKITDSEDLKVRGVDKIIHAVGPIWSGFPLQEAEKEKLSSAYRASLQLALANGIDTVIFPTLSAGIFAKNVPGDQLEVIKECIKIAVETTNNFLKTAPKALNIRFIYPDAGTSDNIDFQPLYEEAFQNLREEMAKEKGADASPDPSGSIPKAPPLDVEAFIKTLGGIEDASHASKKNFPPGKKTMTPAADAAETAQPASKNPAFVIPITKKLFENIKIAKEPDYIQIETIKSTKETEVITVKISRKGEKSTNELEIKNVLNEAITVYNEKLIAGNINVKYANHKFQEESKKYETEEKLWSQAKNKHAALNKSNPKKVFEQSLKVLEDEANFYNNNPKIPRLYPYKAGAEIIAKSTNDANLKKQLNDVKDIIYKGTDPGLYQNKTLSQIVADFKKYMAEIDSKPKTEFTEKPPSKFPKEKAKLDHDHSKQLQEFDAQAAQFNQLNKLKLKEFDPKNTLQKKSEEIKTLEDKIKVALNSIDSFIYTDHKTENTKALNEIKTNKEKLDSIERDIAQYKKLIANFPPPATVTTTAAKEIADITFIPDPTSKKQDTGSLKASFKNSVPSTEDISTVFKQLEGMPGNAEIFGCDKVGAEKIAAELFLRCLENNNNPTFDKNSIKYLTDNRDNFIKNIQELCTPSVLGSPGKPAHTTFDVAKIKTHFDNFDPNNPNNLENIVNQALKIEKLKFKGP